MVNNISIDDRECERILTVVDGNWLMQRTWHILNSRKTPLEPTARNLIRYTRFTNQHLEEILQNTHATHAIILFDHGRSSYRLSLLPTYKGNRPPKHNYQQQCFSMFRQYVKRKGYVCLYQEDTEADDIAAWVARTYRNDFTHIILTTVDHDWLQLCDKENKIIVCRYNNQDHSYKYWNYKNASEWLGYPIDLWWQVAALTGDHSDNVPGVPGYGNKTAIRELKAHHGLMGLLKDPSFNSRVLQRNCLLTRLTGDPYKGLKLDVDKLILEGKAK